MLTCAKKFKMTWESLNLLNEFIINLGLLIEQLSIAYTILLLLFPLPITYFGLVTIDILFKVKQVSYRKSDKWATSS